MKALKQLLLPLILSGCGAAPQFASTGALLPTAVATTSGDSHGSTAGATATPDTQAEANATATPKVAAKGTLLELTDEFAANIQKQPVDLVWVIDNSSSMANKAAMVRANFAAFMLTMKTKTDFRLALISKKGTSAGDTGVELSAVDLLTSNIQIEQKVGSYDGLAIAAAATCGKDSSDVSIIGKETVCGIPLEVTDWEDDMGSSVDHNSVQAARGALTSFFRPGATRVYVFATDDNAFGFDSSRFLQAMTAANGGVAPSVFAFRGANTSGASSCTVDNKGAEYDILAQKTSGLTFDICGNWVTNFASLATSVTHLVPSQYSLSQSNSVTIKTVMVDGVAIPAEKYQLSAGKILIDVDVAADSYSKITVTYDYQQP